MCSTPPPNLESIFPDSFFFHQEHWPELNNIDNALTRHRHFRVLIKWYAKEPFDE